MKKRISVCLVLLLGWLASYAQEPADSLAQPAAEQSESAPRPTTDELWDMANTAYINGNFHSAAEVYEEILSRGVSSVKLYYNLANAYFKEDRIGKAILYYKRALRLAPGNDDIRHNLSVAEARTKDNIEDIPEFFFVTWMREARHTMSCTAWSILSLVLLACALALFLVYLLACATYLSATASNSETRTIWKPMTTLGMKVTSVITIISRLTLRSRTLSIKAFFSYFRKRTMR